MSLDPQKLLKELVDKYSTCSAYYDQGEVETLMRAGEWSTKSVKLKVYSKFIRPMIFRFDYFLDADSGGLQFSLLSDGESFRHVAFVDGQVQSTSAIPNVVSAIRPFNGPSFGHIVVMAELLMPAVRLTAECSIDSLTDLRFDQLAVEQGSNQVLLRGSKGAVACSLLIDCERMELLGYDLEMPEPAGFRMMVDRSIAFGREAGRIDLIKF